MSYVASHCAATVLPTLWLAVPQQKTRCIMQTVNVQSVSEL
jgi:hypothetical protein